MMKKLKKSLALILSMLMLISVFQVGASAYFPYINNGGVSDAISKDFQITSVNVTDLYGDAVTSLAAGSGALVSCKVKALGANKDVQLIAVAYSGSEMVAVKRSDVVTLGNNAEDIGVYLTVEKAADSFKAFLWDGSANLIPLTKNADSTNTALTVVDVLLDGVSVKDALEANGNTYSVSIPASQFDMPSVQILTDNPAARVEVTSTKTFPLTKQWDTQAGEAVVTATVTLNGVEKAKYTFNVTQAVPTVTNVIQYKWGGSGQTTEPIIHVTPDEPDSTNGYSINLVHVKEADYTGLDYKQSTLTTVKPTADALPTERVLWRNDGGNSALLMLCNIPPELLNSTFIQPTVLSTGMMTALSDRLSR